MEKTTDTSQAKGYQSNPTSIDWGVTIPVTLILVAFCIFIVTSPEVANSFLLDVFSIVTGSFGWFVLLLTISCTLAALWFALGPLGKKRLGEGIQMSTTAWWGMLLAGACSCSIISLSATEYIYYLQTPPFGAEAYSQEAYTWASAYGPFHWGAMAFGPYALFAVFFGFYLFVRKPTRSVRVSDACVTVLGEERAYGPIGKIIDIIYIMPNMTLHGGVSLGLSTPMVAALISQIFGVEHTLALDAGLLISWSILFGISVYTGLHKGMKFITTLRFWLLIGCFAYVLICGPTSFIFNNALESLGTQAQNFIAMSTYTSAVDGTAFSPNWTIFYFAWFFATSIATGMYYAKICRGRTIRESVFGILIASAFICSVFYWIFGNYSMDLFIKGALPIEDLLAQSPYVATVAIWAQLPMAEIILVVLLIYCYLATWGVVQSAAYVGAMAGTNNMGPDDEPSKASKIFWSLILSALALSLLFLGGLQTVKNAAMLSSVPTICISFLIFWSLGKDMFKIWGQPTNEVTNKS